MLNNHNWVFSYSPHPALHLSGQITYNPHLLQFGNFTIRGYNGKDPIIDHRLEYLKLGISGPRMGPFCLWIGRLPSTRRMVTVGKWERTPVWSERTPLDSKCTHSTLSSVSTLTLHSSPHSIAGIFFTLGTSMTLTCKTCSKKNGSNSAPTPQCFTPPPPSVFTPRPLQIVFCYIAHYYAKKYHVRLGA